ncbi:5'-methylthioadenosine phosphorylase [Mycolicibacterium fortuitum]|uniref:5'-methylthioadenosine phosphorylase n=1 Tax=Mycolicibacterium fortuitum TaxID=1766 RepID=A0A378UWD9_MYCFO|nr:5'-methylthioadenosine phosphorylase [Mycolicibacterium fortuitum]
MLGVIGGSGFYSFFGPEARTVTVDTPYGAPSAAITVGAVGGHEVAFLPRHGVNHEFSPHTVPYRANMWALRTLGVRRILAPCAVGCLTAELGPGSIVVPDQLVDRTRGVRTRISIPAASTSDSRIRTARLCGRPRPAFPGWSTAAPWW